MPRRYFFSNQLIHSSISIFLINFMNGNLLQVQTWWKSKQTISYLGTRLRHHPRSRLGIYKQNAPVSYSIRHSERIWMPKRDRRIHLYPCIYCRPRYNRPGTSKSIRPMYWYNTRIHRTVGICTRCHRAYHNPCRHTHRYNGTDHSNRRRFDIHGLSCIDSHLEKRISGLDAFSGGQKENQG